MKPICISQQTDSRLGCLDRHLKPLPHPLHSRLQVGSSVLQYANSQTCFIVSGLPISTWLTFFTNMDFGSSLEMVDQPYMMSADI